MSTRTTSNIPASTNPSKSSGGHPNDEHAKAHAGSAFAQVAVSGNVIEVWADGAVWDTVANKFLTPDNLKRA